MKSFDEVDDPRRRILVEALALGALCGTFPSLGAAWSLFGDRPQPLPPGRSVYRVRGRATVNGVPATEDTLVAPGDTVETGPDGEMVFVIGGHAMLVRANARLEVAGERREGDSLLVRGLRLLTGALLTVSRDTDTRLKTVTATIGIRGTGWYAEAEPDQTYFCTCYGLADVAASDDPESRETVESRHHDRPLYILGEGPAGGRVRPAPFINHTDQELMLIEALVGREPPFIFPKDDYSGPRRGY